MIRSGRSRKRATGIAEKKRVLSCSWCQEPPLTWNKKNTSVVFIFSNSSNDVIKPEVTALSATFGIA